MSDVASLGVVVTQKGIRQTDDALERLARTGRRTEQEVDRLQDSFHELSRQAAANDSAMRAARGGTSRFGQAAQQAGYQIGDFATQVASGQSALVAFTQQGTQLLGFFGPGGAVLGAVLAIAGAIGVAFANGAFDGAQATESLEDALDGLDKITTTTAEGVNILTKEIAKLAQTNEKAAKLQIALGIAEAETVVRQSISTFSEFTETYDSFVDNFGFSSDDLEDAAAQLRGIQAAGLDAISVLQGNVKTQGGIFVAAPDLKNVIAELNDEFGLSAQQGTRLLDTFFAFDRTPTAENFEKLSTTVQNLAVETDFANSTFTRFAANTLKTAQQIEDAEQRAEYLRNAMGNLGDVAEQSLATVDKVAERAQRAREQELSQIDSTAEGILAGLQTRQEQELSNVQDQIVSLGEARDNQLISEQTFQQASNQLWSNYYANIDEAAQVSAKRRKQLEDQAKAATLTSIQGGLSALQEMFGKSNALSQAAFVAQQGIAAANVFINGEVAASKALAELGPVAGPAAAAAITVATGVSIGAILAQTVAGLSRAQGGEVPAGAPVLVGERGPEVVRFDQPSNVVPNSGLQGAGKLGSVIINQNIAVNGNGDDQLREAMRQAASEGAQQGYQAVLQDFRSNGSIRRSSRA